MNDPRETLEWRTHLGRRGEHLASGRCDWLGHPDGTRFAITPRWTEVLQRDPELRERVAFTLRQLDEEIRNAEYEETTP
jgi:hypothetical protein